MFGLFKSKTATAGSSLFLIPVKVARGSNTEMPEIFSGALVPVFAAAEDYEAAARSAIKKLLEQGYEFLDIQGAITELPAEKWDAFVSASFPEFSTHFPTQEAVLQGMEAGIVFFGPFLSHKEK
jgi:hypothetical protein